jgi:hypothetical protein
MQSIKTTLMFAAKVWVAIAVLGVVGWAVSKFLSPQIGNTIADPASAVGMLANA